MDAGNGDRQDGAELRRGQEQKRVRDRTQEEETEKEQIIVMLDVIVVWNWMLKAEICK